MYLFFETLESYRLICAILDSLLTLLNPLRGLRLMTLMNRSLILLWNCYWWYISLMRIRRLLWDIVRRRSNIEDSAIKVVLINEVRMLLIDAEGWLFCYSDDNSFLDYTRLMFGGLIKDCLSLFQMQISVLFWFFKCLFINFFLRQTIIWLNVGLCFKSKFLSNIVAFLNPFNYSSKRRSHFAINSKHFS